MTPTHVYRLSQPTHCAQLMCELLLDIYTAKPWEVRRFAVEYRKMSRLQGPMAIHCFCQLQWAGSPQHLLMLCSCIVCGMCRPHITTVGVFLNQPQCKRLAKFFTWNRMLRMKPSLMGLARPPADFIRINRIQDHDGDAVQMARVLRLSIPQHVCRPRLPSSLWTMFWRPATSASAANTAPALSSGCTNPLSGNFIF